jgi:hypothetical protein
MSQDEFDFEGAFGTPLERSAPRLTMGVRDERKIVQPQERLAAWLSRGYGLLGLWLLLLLIMTVSDMNTLLLSLGISSVIVLMVVPFLGERPLAAPWRLAGAMIFLAPVVSLVSGVARWLVDSLLGDSYSRFRLFPLAEACQLYLERTATFRVVISVGLLTVLLYQLGRYLVKTQPWVDTRLGVRGYHRYASLLLLAIAGGLLVLPPLYVEWKVSHLQWPASVSPSDETLKRRPLRHGDLSFSTFQGEYENDISPGGLLRDMPDEEFLRGLVDINSRLEEPHYRIIWDDFYFMHELLERVVALKSHSPIALKYLLFVHRERQRSETVFITRDFDRALMAQSQLLIEVDSPEELERWSQLVGGVPEECTLDDLDEEALRLLKRPGSGRLGAREFENHPLTLFGWECGPSLVDLLDNFERKVFLLDYSVRRSSPPRAGKHPFSRLKRGRPTTFWPEESLEEFYWRLKCQTVERDRFPTARLLHSLIAFRKHKLDQGVYPEALHSELKKRFTYTSHGEQAVLEFKAPPQSSTYYKWVMR